jgi:membrane protein implicated in regulation of membrane protease activity
MSWWLWLVLGLALLALELMVPTSFFLLFFGVGALLVGSLGGLGLALPTWAQLLLFSVASVALLLALRPRLLGRLSSGAAGADDTLVGEWVAISSEIAPGALGRGELRGAGWSVHNAGERPLAAGERCRVERVEGLTLHVSKRTGAA